MIKSLAHLQTSSIVLKLPWKIFLLSNELQNLKRETTRRFTHVKKFQNTQRGMITSQRRKRNLIWVRASSLQDIEQYKKENWCYNCGEQGHISWAYLKHKVAPQATKIHHPIQKANEASCLCFAWGKVRHSLILLDPSSWLASSYQLSLLKSWGFKPKRWE